MCSMFVLVWWWMHPGDFVPEMWLALYTFGSVSFLQTATCVDMFYGSLGMVWWHDFDTVHMVQRRLPPFRPPGGSWILRWLLSPCYLDPNSNRIILCIFWAWLLPKIFDTGAHRKFYTLTMLENIRLLYFGSVCELNLLNCFTVRLYCSQCTF